MSEEKNDNDVEETSAPAPATRYFLVGMGRDAATRLQRRQNRSAIRGRRQVRIGPYLVRPNRSVPLTLEQIEAFADQIRQECEIGRLQVRDGDQNLVNLDEVLGLVEPMPDLSESSIDELVAMMKDADGDPPLLAHVRATLVEKAVANVKAETNLEGLEEFARMIEEDATHPLSFGEVELALAERIKELRDEEASEGDEDESDSTGEDEQPSEEPDTETAPPQPDTEPPPPDEDDEESGDDEDDVPYSEWDYADLKAEVKERGLETDSLKKDDLIAALELDDED